MSVMKRHSLDMEDKKSMSRRSRALTLFNGSELVADEASLQAGNEGIAEPVQIRIDEERDADHQVFRYLSNARTSFHIPEDSGMIPQLRFNPGTISRLLSKRKKNTTQFFFNFNCMSQQRAFDSQFCVQYCYIID